MIDSAILDAIAFDANGPVSANVQRHDTSEMLTLAWMNRTSVAEMFATGPVHNYIRNPLWCKGESSGQTRTLVELRLDRAGATLPVLVEQTGVAGHTGRRDCFFVAARDGEVPEMAAPLVLPAPLYG